MKNNLFPQITAIALLGGLLLAGTVETSNAISYTVSIPTGYSLLVNQCDHGSNTANVLFPNSGVHDGDVIIVGFDCSDGALDQSSAVVFDSTWRTGFGNSDDSAAVPPPVLLPGVGFFYYNNNEAYMNTFTGIALVPGTPPPPPGLPCGRGGSYLLGLQTNDVGNYTNITGFQPTEGAQFDTWSGLDFVTNLFTGGSWTLGQPSVPVGHAAKILIPGSPGPSITHEPANQYVAPGQTATFTVGVIGAVPLIYQWEIVNDGISQFLSDGGAISGSATATLTISDVSSNNAGSYQVVVDNSDGAETSSTASLVVSNATQSFSVVYQGFTNTSLGQATMTVSSNQLVLSNLGNSGLDGVGIALDDTNSASTVQDTKNIADGAAKEQTTDLVIHLQNTDPSNSLPIGAYLQSQYIGFANGVADGVLGTLTDTKECAVCNGSNWLISADFSPIGVSTYTVAVYYQGNLEAQVTNNDGAMIATVNMPPWGKDVGDIITPLSDDWPDGSGALLTLAGATTSLPCDQLIVSPLNFTESVTNTSLQIVASQIPVITIDAENQSLVYQNFLNTSLGNATMTVSSNQLVLSNLGNSGLDGVGIALDDTNSASTVQDTKNIADGAAKEQTTDLVIHLQNTDPSNSLPIGAYLQSQYIGFANGVADGVLGTLTDTKECAVCNGSDWLISADFSPMGVTNYIVTVYYQGNLEAQVTNNDGAMIATVNIPPRGKDVGDIITPLSDDWPDGSGALLTLAGATTSLPCDQLIVSPLNFTESVTNTGLQIVASQIPVITIDAENQSLVYQSFLNTSLGQATVIVSSNQLILSNLGNSGLDGIAVEDPNFVSTVQDSKNISDGAAKEQTTDLVIHMQNLDPSNSLPVGAYLQSQYIGSANGVANGVLGTLTDTKECAVCNGSNWLISADFSPIGVSTYTVAVYYQGNLEAQVTNNDGAMIATVNMPPWGKDVGDIITPLSDDWPDGSGALLTLAGATTSLPCDQLIVSPLNFTESVTNTSFQIVASQISVIIIDSENQSLVYQNFLNTSLGQATMTVFGNQLTVANIGNSGLDGIAVADTNHELTVQDTKTVTDGAAQGQTTDLVIHWQNLDPTNSLPIGAYLQSQYIGFANGVADGVLGTLTDTKECAVCNGSDWLISADFSPMGVTNYIVTVYYQGNLEAQVTNNDGAMIATVNIPPRGKDVGDIITPLSDDWPDGSGALLTLAGATTSLPCDQLIVSPLNFTESVTNTGLQIVASQIPVITIDAENQSLLNDGLVNTTLGQASIVAGGGTNHIENLGSSGQDGVEIDIGSFGDFGLNFSPQWPAGAGTVTVTELGYTNGQSGVTVARDSITSDGSNYIYSFDFSPVGATSYTLAVFNGLQLVYESQNNNNSSPAFDTGVPPIKFKLEPLPPDTVPWPPLNVPDPPFQQFNFNTCPIVVGGSTVTGDHVDVFPNQANAFAAVSGAQIQSGGNISQFDITGESLGDVNADATALGNAVFSPQGTNLTLLNLGSSGQDGVSLALANGVTGLAVTWQALDQSNSLPPGAYVESQMIGTSGAVNNGVLGSTTCTKAGTSNYVISVDYSPLGSSTHTIQVYNGGTLVGQLTGQAGSICANTKLPPGTTTYNPLLNDEWPGQPIPITLNGGPTYMGTELLILPEGGTPIGSLTGAHILTANIPSLTLTALNALSDNYGGLQQSPLGNATLTVGVGSLIVGNLGNSGQDGISMPLLGGSTAMAAHWLSLDPSNSLPVGSYLLQQIYGNTASITNGLLGSVQVTKVGTGNYALTASFPGAASNQCLVQVFNGSTLVGSATNSSTGALCTLPQLPTDFDSGTSTGPTFPDPDDNSDTTIGGVTFHGTGTIPILLDGIPVEGDMVLISSLSAPPVTAMTGLNILSSGISQIVITNETVTTAYGSLADNSLGNASLSVSSNQLTVSNLGGSGQDGVAIGVATNFTGLDFEYQELESSNPLPVGAYIEMQEIGTANGVTNGMLGEATMTKAGTSNYVVSANFSPIGSSNYITLAYYQGALVGQATNQTGPSVAVFTGVPDSIGYGTPPDDDIIVVIPTTPIYFDWQFPVMITVSGTMMPCDHLIVLPENPSIKIAPASLQIVAAEVPAVTLTGVNVLPMAVNLKRTGQAVTLSWYGTAALQQSSNLAAWTDTTNAASPYTISTSPSNGSAKFYRLVFKP